LKGDLTRLRSALVNNSFFARLAVGYDFHKYMTYSNESVLKTLTQFVEYVKKSDFLNDTSDDSKLSDDVKTN
jgi:endoribonuclease Dicer